jgi:hypothetical protein
VQTGKIESDTSLFTQNEISSKMVRIPSPKLARTDTPYALMDVHIAIRRLQSNIVPNNNYYKTYSM